MTKGRLDDQRGLEINGELPEFLKKKEETRGRVSEPVRSGGIPESEAQARLSGPPELGWDRDHAKHFIDYIDSTFTSDGGGLIPSNSEADQLFNPVARMGDPNDSINCNGSRLSLGLGQNRGMKLVQRPSIAIPGARDYEGVNFHQQLVGRDSIGSYGSASSGKSGRMTPSNKDYDNANIQFSYDGPIGGKPNDYEGVKFKGGGGKDYEHIGYRGGVPVIVPPQIAPKPRLQSVEEDPYSSLGGDISAPKRPPPPLPPKPLRGPPPLPPHAQHLHENFGKVGSPPDQELPPGVTRTKSGVYLGIPGEKGYNVSFV